MISAGAAMLPAAAAWACPSCNQGLENDPAGLAFYWGTLFMMAMPYSVALTVGGGLFYVYWRAARNAPAALETDNLSWSVEGPERRVDGE